MDDKTTQTLEEITPAEAVSVEPVEITQVIDDEKNNNNLGSKRTLFVGIGLVLLVVVVVAVLVFNGTFAGVGKVAARVDGTDITTKTLDSEMQKLALADGGSSLSAEEQLQYRSAILDELISQQLIQNEATKNNVEVSDEEVDSAVNSVEVGYGGEASFEEALKNAGLSRDSFKNQIRWQLLATGLLEKAVPESSLSEEEIEAFYEANLVSFTTEGAKRCSHILYATEDKDKAEAALKKIKAGADFAEIAKSESTDAATAKSGGDLGWPTTAYVQEFQEAVDSLAPGDEPKIVRSVYGYHIVKVTDERLAGQTSLEDCRDQVVQELLNQKRSLAYSSLISNLRKSAKIEILDEKVNQYVAAQSSVGQEDATDSTNEETSSGK